MLTAGGLRRVALRKAYAPPTLHGDFFADGEAGSDDAHELPIEFVDACTECCQVAHP